MGDEHRIRRGFFFIGFGTGALFCGVLTALMNWWLLCR